MAPLILALLIAVADPSAGASQSTSQGAMPPTDEPLVALKEAQSTYERALQLYKESCEDRAYGAYDDLCGQLKHQVHQYRVDLDRQERVVSNQTAAPHPRP